MTYARWHDEGLVAVGDAPVDAPCPDDCDEGTSCGICSLTTCPTHGMPPGVGDSAADSHLTDMCVGECHRVCHDSTCRDAECWSDK